MHTALETLKLDELVIIHAGSESFPLRANIRAIALRRLRDDIEPIRA
jgi:hypothetical protein